MSRGTTIQLSLASSSASRTGWLMVASLSVSFASLATSSAIFLARLQCLGASR